MNEGSRKHKSNRGLRKKVLTLSSLLSQMCCHADEDTPAEYRTKHFKSTMDESYEYLEEIGYLKGGQMKIKVTKEDIENGEPGNSSECAISLALQRHYNTNNTFSEWCV